MIRIIGLKRQTNKDPAVFEYLEAHDIFILWLTIISIVTFVATLIAVPWLIIHMPADYFTHDYRRKTGKPGKALTLKILIVLAKNLLGLVLVAAGFIMLFIPGQGLLTIGIGIVLLDFPGKYTAERWVVRRAPIRRSINRIRKRAFKPPLAL